MVAYFQFLFGRGVVKIKHGNFVPAVDDRIQYFEFNYFFLVINIIKQMVMYTRTRRVALNVLIDQ